MSRAIALAMELLFDSADANLYREELEAFYTAARNDGLRRAAEICMKGDHEYKNGQNCAEEIRKEIS